MHRRFPFLVPCQLAWQEHQVGSLWLFSDMARPLPACPAGTKGWSATQHTCLANQPASPVGQAGQGSVVGLRTCLANLPASPVGQADRGRRTPRSFSLDGGRHGLAVSFEFVAEL
jgi:hypothetical protein